MNKPTDKNTELQGLMIKRSHKPANTPYVDIFIGSELIATDLYPQHAQYIVKACNSYPDLIKQRDELLESLKEMMDALDGKRTPGVWQKARNLINKIGVKI